MHFAHALDLGCGTGLAGVAFRDCVERLEGIDLSPGMVAEARAKGIYDALHVGEVVAHLKAATDRQFDLILAADVLVYVGDLAPLFLEVARVLASETGSSPSLRKAMKARATWSAAKRGTPIRRITLSAPRAMPASR